MHKFQTAVAEQSLKDMKLFSSYKTFNHSFRI